MKPWEIVIALNTDPSSVLNSLDSNDPDVFSFYMGASYAIDPFVGAIVRLPMRRDPTEYGNGIDPQTFEKLVKIILNGDLTGDRLVMSLELLSKSCREDEWLLWYKPILQGEMDIPISLEIFNKYCPSEYQIPLPALNKPKQIIAMADFPQRFIIQPLYPFKYTFWFINSMHPFIEIRGYDSESRRIRDDRVIDILTNFARSTPIDIVLMGYMTGGSFMASDILPRDHFTRESGVASFENRLLALIKFGIPIVQASPALTLGDEFYKELGLVFEQGFTGVVIRDIDATYPFRVQCDLVISPTIKGTVICTKATDVGMHGETKRGENVIKSFTRLGLKSQARKDISESVGRRFDVLSCGQKNDELLLPIFQNWRG